MKQQTPHRVICETQLASLVDRPKTVQTVSLPLPRVTAFPLQKLQFTGGVVETATVGGSKKGNGGHPESKEGVPCGFPFGIQPHTCDFVQ